MNRRFLNIELLLVIILFIGMPCRSNAAPGQPLVIFISDLHLGVGTTRLEGEPGSETLSRLEDFRWSPEFGKFLDYIDNESGSNTTLVVLGDALELWQSSHGECTGDAMSLSCVVRDCANAVISKNFGCSEAEVVERIRVIVNQHRDVFERLGSFATKGHNKLIIVPGNHDAALMLPRVAELVRSAITLIPNPQVVIDDKGYWISADGKVWGEHGHQFDKVNSFEGWPKPWAERPNARYLLRPWGEGLVQDFYNQYEVMFPVVDNLSSEMAGVRLALASGDFPGAATALQRFATFLLKKNSGTQFLAFLGDDRSLPSDARSKKWAIATIRANNGIAGTAETGPAFIANGFLDADLRRLAVAAVANSEFTLKVADLDDDAIIGICDARVVRAKREGTQVLQCPSRGGGDLGYVFDKVTGRDVALLRGRLLDIYKVVQQVHPGVKPKFFVYGHTHGRGHKPYFKVTTDWYLDVYNTGAFQRVADENQVKDIMRSKGLSDADTLRALRPEDLPPCYTFIRVDYTGGEPVAEMWYWSQSGAGWASTKTCIFGVK